MTDQRSQAAAAPPMIDEALNRPSYQYFYFVLATFDLLAICLALMFGNRVVNSSLSALNEDRSWAYRQGIYSELTRGANQCRQPAHDAVQARNTELAAQQFAQNLRAFREDLDRVRFEAQTHMPASHLADLMRRFSRLQDLTRKIEQDAERVLALVESDEGSQATPLLTSIDESYAQITDELAELSLFASNTLELRYESQIEQLVRLRGYQWWMAVCGTLFVSIISFYGHRFSNTVQTQVHKATQQTTELAEKEARLRTIVDTAADGIVTMNHQGIVESCNEAMVKLFARDRNDLIGKPIFMLMEEIDDNVEASGQLTLCLLDINALIGTKRELRGMRPDGTKFYVELAVAEVRFSDRRIITGIIHDVTERREFEAQLKNHRQAAEAATEAKSQFLANMSHEIRTPMTAIIGYSDLLLEPGQSDEERQRCVQTVRRNADHLLNLINDILDISKIEAGKMTVETIALSPCQIIGDVASLMRVRAIEKNIGFEVIYDSPIPAEINGDPVRVRQILLNLVGNAIKFTKSGQVRIHTTCLDITGDKPRMNFRVVDSGIGLTQEQLGRLFQPFTQADYSTTRQFGGTGLGLTICRRLVEMMGGEITVASVPGLGSSFEFTIPTGSLQNTRILAAPGEAESIRQSPNVAKGTQTRLTARVLLAEDGPDNYRLISHHLTRAGATVVHAENGQQAFEKALDADRIAQPFDVVLMDMQMPVLDGYQATSNLRARGYWLPIIALTAHAMSGDRDKCLNAGCTDFLTKPIDPGLLIETVRKYAESPLATRHSQTVTQTVEQSAEFDTPADKVSEIAVIAATAVAAAAPDVTMTEDDEVIVSEFADDPEMMEIVDEFLKGLEERANELETALAQNNYTKVASVAHTVKGAAGGYGYSTVGKLAGEIEWQAKPNGDPSQLPGLFKSFDTLCRRAVAGRALSSERWQTSACRPATVAVQPISNGGISQLDAVIQQIEASGEVDSDLRTVGIILKEISATASAGQFSGGVTQTAN